MVDFESLFNDSFEKTVIDKNEVKNKVDECRNVLTEKFGDIRFIEEGHKYFINDIEYIPVSNIIKKYEPYVDWDKKAEDYARKYGKRKENVQKSWRLNNLKSTISGTRTHEFGESYTNLMCGHPELICEQNKPQYVKDYNELISTYPKEDAVKKFYDDLEDSLHPVGAEFKLSSKYIEDSISICGTCDLLFYDSLKKKYVIGDWKTNKSLINEYSRKHGIMMEGCMSKFIDEHLSHYTLQFNIYQRMLESIGIEIADRILIWLKDDGTYERINIDRIDDNIMDIILKDKK